LNAERGLTMLELAERLGNAGFRWLVAECSRSGWDGLRPLDQPVVADRLMALEDGAGRSAGAVPRLVDRHEAGTPGRLRRPIVKLYYSELLQRLTDFGRRRGGSGGSDRDQ